jgi:outer membrane protein OmpA-like peptidoglycan-associated protein
MWIAALLLQSVAPEGSTLVFFDWGKSEVTRDGQGSLDKVAQDYRANPGPLAVIGHSDRSGPAEANLGSSRQRAQIVADYLADKGVPRAAMTIEGRGEAEPIIATEDGVREVQNRRVEIRRR